MINRVGVAFTAHAQFNFSQTGNKIDVLKVYTHLQRRQTKQKTQKKQTKIVSFGQFHLYSLQQELWIDRLHEEKLNLIYVIIIYIFMTVKYQAIKTTHMQANKIYFHENLKQKY